MLTTLTLTLTLINTLIFTFFVALYVYQTVTHSPRYRHGRKLSRR